MCSAAGNEYAVGPKVPLEKVNNDGIGILDLGFGLFLWFFGKLCTTSLQEGLKLVSYHCLGELYAGGNFGKCHATLFEAHYLFNDIICKFTATFGLGSNRFSRRTKKGPKITAKPFNSLGDLAHTIDERSVTAYPADPLALVVLSWEETLINLDYLLAWYHPLLKTIRNTQTNNATSRTRKSIKSELVEVSSSQSGEAEEITLKPSSIPGSGQQISSYDQSDAS
ncbi:hypothetical protein DSO57_1034095 [Entomophthora muscae]|uniref:Uncharacterized protein n=1 Tax=Entomophthora muscae TaxID=34485 RepID=A0ACC2SCU7_9FUNG|nr:hypothetical protein DSO57_1034095 [Entomophthora muscae]